MARWIVPIMLWNLGLGQHLRGLQLAVIWEYGLEPILCDHYCVVLHKSQQCFSSNIAV